MKHSFLLILCGVVFFASCRKDADNNVPPPVDADEKILVSLQPGGEFTVGEPQSGARYSGVLAAAKSKIDSTIYLVEVYTGDTLYGFGVYNVLDSVRFRLDPIPTYKIRLTVYQKGTGLGLYFTGSLTSAVSTNYQKPFMGFVTNSMYFYPNIPSYYVTPLGVNISAKKINTFRKEDQQFAPFDGYIGEVIMYGAEVTNFKVNPNNAILAMQLKRLSFGIKFTCPQFTQGRIIVYYPYNELQTKIYYPNTIDNSLSIYSATDFLRKDSLNGSMTPDPYRLNPTIQWALDDGRRFTILQSATYPNIPMPKRNHVINFNITLPSLDSTANNSPLRLNFTETKFSDNTPIRF